MTAWYLIEVEGSRKPLQAFVAGFCLGRGERQAVLLGSDCGLAPSSLPERVRELFTAGSHEVLLAPDPLAAELREALLAAGARVGLEVLRYALVLGARLAFSAETASTDLAAEIKRELLSSLPPQVKLEQLEEHEEREPEARGTELYAPVHDFVYRASGIFAGPLPGILELRRRTQTMETVTADAIELEADPPPPASAPT